VVTSQDIQDAADGLRGIARRTELRYVEELGAHLKLENEQPIGAFKIRGAYNAIRRLPSAVRKRGVITFSSGNHGQAVAYAAKEFRRACGNCDARNDARGESGRGQEVGRGGRLCGPHVRGSPYQGGGDRPHGAARGRPAVRSSRYRGGQATVALEIVEQLPEVETVVVPVAAAA